jgi:ribosome assembly protein SQT1
MFPNPPLAITGGEDDLGYIFSPIPSSSNLPFNGETFPAVKLTGHTDSVVAAGWSFDGEMIATGGMDGRVRVWRRVTGRRGSAGDGQAEVEGVEAWKTWEFLTSLETSSEIIVS